MKNREKLTPKPKRFLNENERKENLIAIHADIRAISDTEEQEKQKKVIASYKRSERRIHHTSTQDILLYLFTKHYLDEGLLKLTAAAPNWSLHTLEKDLLNTAIHYELPVPETNKSLYHPGCKIRNLGELRLLVRDRRLPSLLAYYSPDELTFNHAEIRAELASYRRAKVKIMGLVHQLEKTIIQHTGNVTKRSNDLVAETEQDFGKARHGDFLYQLHQHAQQENNQEWANMFELSLFNKTLEIRNAFSHNQYPKIELFEEIATQARADQKPENPSNHRKIAERLLQAIEGIYTPWLNFFK